MKMIIVSSRLRLRDSDNFSEKENYYEASFTQGGAASVFEKTSDEIKSLLNNKNILLLVHGYNNDFDDVIRSYNIIKKNIEKNNINYDFIVGYTWPGGDQRYEYYPAKRRSSIAAGRLIDLRNKISPKSIDVMSHSMGCRVVLRALSEMESNQPIIRYHLAVASAVDDESVEYGERFYDATQKTEATWVFHSKYDNVLKIWYQIGELDTALGLYGPDDKQSIERYSKNVKVINCRHHVKEHGEYKKKSEFYKFFRGIVVKDHPKSRQFFTLS